MRGRSLDFILMFSYQPLCSCSVRELITYRRKEYCVVALRPRNYSKLRETEFNIRDGSFF
jgi:hypothetical protein